MKLRSDHVGAVAEVSDNGPGIPEQKRGRVFRRFYRLKHSRTTQGSGLGLSLVEAIAQLHASLELLDNGPGLRVECSGSLQKDIEEGGPIHVASARSARIVASTDNAYL